MTHRFVWLSVVLASAQATAAVTNEQVESAIERYREALLTAQDPHGHWERQQRFGGYTSRVHGGVTALSTLALLLSGESHQRPELASSIDWLRQTEGKGTYTVALRNHVWAQLPDAYRDSLLQDTQWLLRSDSQGRYRYTPEPASWDNSATQYAVLGLWEALKRGVPIPTAKWKQIENHFLSVQNADGGWHYQDSGESYGSMTCAGLTGLLVTQQVLYRDNNKPDQRLYQAIERGLNWMDGHFNGATNPNHGGHAHYYCYGIERVALASGVRYLNGQDWFSSIAQELVDAGSTPNKINNAFALMFLSRGHVPVWITKIGVPGTKAWNNRPNDLYFLTQWLSDQREGELNWQVMSLDRPAEDFLTAPMAWLASDRPLVFTPGHIATIRRYLDLGGTLIVNPDRRSPSFQNSIKDLAAELYPGRRMQPVPADHPIYHLQYKIHRVERRRIMHLQNGVRDLIIMPASDWGMIFQAQDPPGRTDSFKLMANLLALVTNRGVLPKRLVPRFESRQSGQSSAQCALGRAKYDGNWLPEPAAWEPLSRHLYNRAGLELLLTPEDVLSTEALPSQPNDQRSGGRDPSEQILEHDSVCHLSEIGDSNLPLVHLAGVDAIELTDELTRSIKQYIERGGTILVETIGGLGDFASRVEEQLRGVLHTAVLPLAADEPIISGRGIKDGYDNRRVDYRRFAVLDRVIGHRPRLAAFYVQDRPAVIISQEDLSLGVLGVTRWGIVGYTKESATRLLANLVLWVHQNASMKRLKIDDQSSVIRREPAEVP